MAPRLRHPFAKRPAWQTLLALGEGEDPRPPGVTLRLSRSSPFQLDLDNAFGGAKFLIDQLRYCGLIPGDNPQEIQIEFRQTRTQHKNEAGTWVEIWFENSPLDQPLASEASQAGT